MSHWKYKGETLTEPDPKFAGFVYMITNTQTGQKYIGRKYFSSTRKKPLTAKQKREGKVRRSKVTSSSGWETYTSSCKPLNDDITTNGKEHFSFDILGFGYTRGQVNYLEELFQYRHNVLTDPLFYNEAIGPKRYAGLKKDAAFHRLVMEAIEKNQ